MMDKKLAAFLDSLWEIRGEIRKMFSEMGWKERVDSIYAFYHHEGLAGKGDAIGQEAFEKAHVDLEALTKKEKEGALRVKGQNSNDYLYTKGEGEYKRDNEFRKLNHEMK